MAKEISAKDVAALRAKTGAGMMDCKRALAETGGDMNKAVEYLRKKGMAQAEKRSGRSASEGWIGHYVHFNGRVAVLVEVNCETDFVARTDDFRALTRDLAAHIAASRPLTVTPEELPADLVDKESEIYREQAKESGKPETIWDKIVEGKLQKFYAETVLMEQPYVKDQTGKSAVKDAIKEAAGKLGENLVVRRFVRFELGEE